MAEKNISIKQMRSPPKIKTIRSEEFREITQDRIFGGFREGYFIYIIQNEKFNTSDNEDEENLFVDEVQVKVSPQQVVKTYELLGRLIKQYEKIFGEIKTLEHIASENPDLIEDA